MTIFKSLFTSLSIGIFACCSAPLGAQARTYLAQSTAPNATLEAAQTSSGNFLAAIIAGSVQDIGPAAKYYAETMKSDPKNTDLLDRALLTALADGNMSEAFRFAEKAIKRDAKAPLPNLALAVRAIKTRQFAQARVYLERSAGKLVKFDPMSALLTAWTYVGEGRANKGITYAQSLTLGGATDLRNYMLGLMADISGRKEDALKTMESAYEADKNNITGAETYARMQARLGDKNIAIKVLEEAAALSPNDPQINMPLADIKAGRIPEPLVKTSIEGAAQVFYLQAGSRARPGEELLLLIYMQFANFLAPDNDRIQLSLGESFAGLNQHERAISQFESLDKGSIFHRRAMIRKAFSLETSEKSDAAITTLNELVNEKQADLESLNSLAVMLRVKKRWPEAIAAYTKAIDIIGKPTAPYWSLYHGRGICYERNKEWPQAEADLKIALDLLPDDPTKGPMNAYNRAQVLNYLGYSWVDRGMNLDKAFPMLKRAVELTDQRDGYIIDSLGWAYYRQNQLDDALRELERALALKPSDPVINDHLGDVYWRVGRKLEAQFQWNHARDLKPEADDLVLILKKIENGWQEPNTSTSAQTPIKPNGG
jgi:tetratricopeptide (TPR) repeat protein